MNKIKKILCFLLIIGIVFIHVSPIQALSDSGKFIVTGGEQGIDWIYRDGSLNIEKSGNYVITTNGEETSDQINVSDNFEGTITLKNVNIHATYAAMNIQKHTKLTLMLEGENYLIAKNPWNAGLQVNNALDSDYSGYLVIDSLCDGSLKAEGGENGGAGIGGGAGSAGGSITVNGGRIIVSSRGRGDGIGNGSGANKFEFNTKEDGNAIIMTNSISDRSHQDNWSAIIFENNDGKVYGKQSLSSDFVIPEDKTLVIPDGGELIVLKDVTLKTHDNILNNGILKVDGTLDGDIKGSKVLYKIEVIDGNADKEYSAENEIITLTENVIFDTELKEWKVNDNSITGNTFVMPAQTVKVVGIYTPKIYTITIESNGNGTGLASQTSATSSTEINLNAVADSGYHFKEWQVVLGNIDIKDNKFNMPTSNVVLKAIFEADVIVNEYKIIEGMDQSWINTDAKELSLQIDGDMNHFIGIKIDGTFIDSSYYTVESQTITINKDYLKTLNEGLHIITIAFDNGEISTHLTIQLPETNQNQPSNTDTLIKEDTPSSPLKDKIIQSKNKAKTNDEYMIITYIILLISTIVFYKAIKGNKNHA